MFHHVRGCSAQKNGTPGLYEQNEQLILYLAAMHHFGKTDFQWSNLT